MGDGFTIHQSKLRAGQDHRRAILDLHRLRIVVTLKMIDAVSLFGQPVRMPGLPPVRLLIQMVMRIDRHQKIGAEQRADDTGYLGM